MFLTPTWTIADLTQLPIDELKANGVAGFIFDLDNTIMAPHTGMLTETMTAWLASLTAAGLPYIVVSNNKNRAYMDQAQAVVGVPVLGPAAKPRRQVLQQALDWLQLPAHQVAVVGDRPLTDIWGGQRLGCPTVLVDPLRKGVENELIQFLRWLERLTVSPASRE
jgi:uncharacterized protein